MTSDGIWDYGYDAENRLVSMQTTSNAVSYSFPNRVLQFKYDYAGRRIQKRVIDGGTSAEISSRRFVYDGWNLVAEYNAPGGTSLGTIVRSYTWGLDIASSLGRSGGVGALLQIVDHATGNSYLPTYDANGNVTALLNGANGNAAAIYEYSPFGEPVRAQVNDSTVAEQPFRFSTKFTDVETGLVYYGHRYYEPRNGRFINRDPIEESGGLNLYGFCGNNGINRWDVLGHEVGEHLSTRDDGTTFISYFAHAVDADGRVGEWNFGSEEDAYRWAEAWKDGNRDLTDPYIYRKPDDEETIQDPSEVNDDEWDDDGYGGYDPNAMHLIVNGVNTGKASGSDAAFYDRLANHLTQPAAAAAATTPKSTAAPTSGSFNSTFGKTNTSLLGGASATAPHGGARVSDVDPIPAGLLAAAIAGSAHTRTSAIFLLPAIPWILGGAGSSTIVSAVAGAATGVAVFFGGQAVYNSTKSTDSKPTNAPPGTIPIDQSGLPKGDIHTIKDQVHGPRSGTKWTGISPNGDVITTGPDGKMIDNGPKDSYLPGS